ncbi:MAG: type II toxin-antitoxin system VapC family toxin [Terracidiphilus sp.]|jgi:predicted nucleic acid-binding protein
MVGTKVLFDTNILIDHLSGVDRAGAELRRYQDRAISIITWMEVMAGSNSEDESRIRAFLSAFRCLPVTTEVAERSFAVRRQRKLNLPDAIILATAETADRLLITRNTRDFPADDPGIRVPYQLHGIR